MYLWEEEMSVGNETLDKHHKIFLDQLSQFWLASRIGRSPEKSGELLLFLMDYAKEHFVAEEKYMSDYGYPDLEAHAKIHAKLVNKLIEYQQRLKKEGSSPDLAIEIRDFTGGWLIHHIKTADMAYARYIEQKKLRSVSQAATV